VEENTMDKNRQYGYRSFFWPIVLIGVGAIMLLANLDILPTPSVRLLLRLWPLALIVLGLDLIVGRRSPLLGALIGLAAIALVILLLYFAPSLNLERTVEKKTINLNTPLGNTQTANVTLDLERYATTIGSNIDSDDLFTAVLDTYTDVDYVARGGRRATIELDPVDANLYDLDWSVASTRDMLWEIDLSPDVLLDLSVDVGSGSADLDLFDLMLSDLTVDGGSGSTDLAIPDSGELFPVYVDGGSGSFDIQIEDGANLDADFDVGSGSFDVIVGSRVSMELTLDGGSGSIFIDLSDDAGVRVVVDDRGSGGVRLPADYDLVDDMNDDDRDTGIWETDDYDEARYQIEIRFDPGSGTLTVR
jgi:hypothetical protein